METPRITLGRLEMQPLSCARMRQKERLSGLKLQWE